MTENTSKINARYNELIQFLTPEELDYDCSLDKGLLEYCTTHPNAKYDNLIENLTSEEELKWERLKNIDWSRYQTKGVITTYKNIKKIFKKYNVDYTNKHCLIYMDKNFKGLYNPYLGEGAMEEIYDLFLKYYNMEEIDCSGKNITSIPILPKLKKLNCSENDLTCLPNLENLEELNCLNNRFIDFPGISNIREKGAQITHSTTYSVFPKLKLFNGNGDYRNRLQTRLDRPIMMSISSYV